MSRKLSFMKLCDIYHRFVPKFTMLASMPNKKSNKGELLQFGIEKNKRQAVDVSKEKLITLSVLALTGLNGK